MSRDGADGAGNGVSYLFALVVFCFMHIRDMLRVVPAMTVSVRPVICSS